jgi:hypothetical integral membrane protein (TIGR02206 family)
MFAFCIYAIFTYQEFIRKNMKPIIVVVLVLLIWSQIARYGLSLLRDGFVLGQYMPFYICRISSLVLLYYVITKDKRVESFLFYWGATGLAGIIYPNGSIDNIVNLTETFYIDHFLLGLTPFFLVVYRGYQPNRQNLISVTLFMLAVLLFFIPINALMDTDFFYTKDQSIFGVLFPNIPDSIFGINIAFSSIVFAVVHSSVAFGFFSIYYRYFTNKSYKQV